MIVGFTGTRTGMTPAQLDKVRQLLLYLSNVGHTLVNRFHHGDCVGADKEAALLASHYHFELCAHPPTDRKLRAFIVSKYSYNPEPYLQRNHTIVNTVKLMLAAPREMMEQTRSGTWATVRYTRKIGLPLYLILPNGISIAERMEHS